MVNTPNNDKSRVDYHIEHTFAAFDDTETARGYAERHVRKEDERIWAYYRDPRTDLTQLEARDRAQRADYPDRYNVSQSSVSRLLTRLDDAMLTEQVETIDLGADVPEEVTDREHRVAGLLARHDRERLKREGFSDLLDAYRDALARFIVDLRSLRSFMATERVTPEHAAERFPELDPDIGRKYGLREDFVTESEAAEPFDEAHKDAPTIADD